MNPEIIEKIKENYNRARENPYFCDMFTCLSEDGVNAHLDICRITLAEEIKTNNVEINTLLFYEFYKAIQAYQRDDIPTAIEEFIDMIVVCLRGIDVLEGRQALGDPAKKSNNN